MQVKSNIMNRQLKDVRCQIKSGCIDAGREGVCLTDSFNLEGLDWVVVLWLDNPTEEGMEIRKTSCLEFETPRWVGFQRLI